MARRRRRTIAHNPLDEPVSAAVDIGLDDNPGRRRARLRRTESTSTPRAAPDEGSSEAPMAGRAAEAERGNCWMWWIGAGVVGLLILG